MTWGAVYDNPKFTRRGQSILKRLEKIERIDHPVLERKKMDLKLAGWRGSQKVLEIAGLRKSFPLADDAGAEKVVLDDLALLVRHGERVGMIGPNGAGKSLLFRLILGQDLATAGEIELGPSVRVAYYAQQHETLDLERTLIDTVRLAGNFSQEAAVAFLGKFLFTYQQALRRRAEPAATGAGDALGGKFLVAGRANQSPGYRLSRGAGRGAGGFQGNGAVNFS
jgi:ATP-binding cassette subfamily F protein 3